MKTDLTFEQLLQNLVAAPSNFDANGENSLLLLQYYVDGHDVRTLKPLLSHRNTAIRRTAAFIASELGQLASDLIDEAVLLLKDDDGLIEYFAMDVVMVCSVATNTDKFVEIIKKMDSAISTTRRRAMFLVSNADVSQLSAALQFSTRSLSNSHTIGIESLLKSNRLHVEEVEALINGPDPLLRRYGAIIARRLFQKFPELNATAASSTDSDLNQFALETSKSIVFFKPDKGRRHLYPDTYFDGD